MKIVDDAFMQSFVCVAGTSGTFSIWRSKTEIGKEKIK